MVQGDVRPRIDVGMAVILHENPRLPYSDRVTVGFRVGEQKRRVLFGDFDELSDAESSPEREIGPRGVRIEARVIEILRYAVLRLQPEALRGGREVAPRVVARAGYIVHHKPEHVRGTRTAGQREPALHVHGRRSLEDI